MSEIKKIATRESYGAALVSLAEKYDNVVALDADVAGATKTIMLAKKFPKRHINCGIAEANMVGVAAGLSTTGIVPFVSSFAMFLAGRAFDQIRNSIGYPHLNVKLCATHGGISVGEDGASHQCCEDFALMRSIPGMVVICPSDDVEAKSVIESIYNYEGPVYVRFGRLAVPVINQSDYKFQLGKGKVLRDGSNIAIIANGLMVAKALDAANELSACGIECRVINMATIKPLDTELVIKAAKECKYILTAEEHNIIGGLGEAVAAVVSEIYPVPVYRIGVTDVFGHSGAAEKLLLEFGLSAENIVSTVKKILKK